MLSDCVRSGDKRITSTATEAARVGGWALEGAGAGAGA